MIKAATIKLPFGINENNIPVQIADVVSGKKCNCICPECKSPLIAVKGKMKQHHFRHAVNNGCVAGFESSVHLAAKHLIMSKKEITVSECVAKASKTDSKGGVHLKQKIIVRKGAIIRFDSVQKERELHGMRADILATKGDRQLIIEIRYRHKVEDGKIERIKKANISAIEIDLSDLTSEDEIDWETLWTRINDPKRIQWLHHVEADVEKRKLEKELEEDIKKLEEKYKQEEIIKKRLEQQLEVKYKEQEIIKKRQEQQEDPRKHSEEQKEKTQLLQALEDLKILRGKEHMAQLKQEAETHPFWKRYSREHQRSLNGLQDFLNVDVPDGDWIFGCDRRIWQTAFYSQFICKNGKPFCIKRVDEWLNIMCKIPSSAKIIRIYSRSYPKLVSADVSRNIPRPWKTLLAYFNHLCELRMLEFAAEDLRLWGNVWFRVLRKTPDSAQYK